MAAETQAITQDNPAITERELLEDIQARLIRLDGHLTALLGAWSDGGLRGLRAAGRNFLSRPDPDGTRTAMLADGLASLGDSHDRH